jgi:hypothetical protein
VFYYLHNNIVFFSWFWKKMIKYHIHQNSSSPWQFNNNYSLKLRENKGIQVVQNQYQEYNFIKFLKNVSLNKNPLRTTTVLIMSSHICLKQHLDKILKNKQKQYTDSIMSKAICFTGKWSAILTCNLRTPVLRVCILTMQL